MQRVLVLSPHPDDAEFGCGATMSVLAERGMEIRHVLISASEKTTMYPGMAQCIEEFRQANAILGVKDVVYDELFEHRMLQRDRQQLLQYLTRVREAFHPDTVFMPCLDDTHQDHAAVATEAFRAFKHCDLLGYDILWNNLAFNSQAFHIIYESALEKKVAALMAYKSQKLRSYFDPELVRASARMRGAQAGSRYAEGFSNIRRFF